MAHCLQVETQRNCNKISNEVHNLDFNFRKNNNIIVLKYEKPSIAEKKISANFRTLGKLQTTSTTLVNQE
jgi:hypothetical protein